MLQHVSLVIRLKSHIEEYVSITIAVKKVCLVSALQRPGHQVKPFGDYFLQLAVMRLLLTCDIPWVDNEPSSISSPMFQINSVNVITCLISSFGPNYAPLVVSLS